MASETSTLNRQIGEAVIGSALTVAGVLLILYLKMTPGQVIATAIGTIVMALWAGLSIKDCIVGPPSD